jgi:hypothetical protein
MDFKPQKSFIGLAHDKLSGLNQPFSTLQPRNTKGGSITVPLTSCLTGLELAV